MRFYSLHEFFTESDPHLSHALVSPRYSTRPQHFMAFLLRILTGFFQILCALHVLVYALQHACPFEFQISSFMVNSNGSAIIRDSPPMLHALQQVTWFFSAPLFLGLQMAGSSSRWVLLVACPVRSSFVLHPRSCQALIP
eukprot:Gb_04813 [translate_table: standard]